MWRVSGALKGSYKYRLQSIERWEMRYYPLALSILARDYRQHVRPEELNQSRVYQELVEGVFDVMSEAIRQAL
jgi:hypothetical protein